jgi:hypothetical protein
MVGTSFSYVYFSNIKDAVANHKCCECAVTCPSKVISCGTSACACQSNKETPITTKHITDEFIKHRVWIIKNFWEGHLLPAMMLMTGQITATVAQQTQIIGALFDAKHQLETQRILQVMQAEAHKEYHPSEGMCQLGTTTRSLAASSRNTDFTEIAISARNMQRQILSGDGISVGGSATELESRYTQFMKTYCNPDDFGGSMQNICDGSTPQRYNKDLNYTHTVSRPLTLDIDLTDTDTTPDEEDVFALSANLYGHDIMPAMQQDKMVNQNQNKLIIGGASVYMKTRALAAKRSVAQNAYAAQTAMKAKGGEEVKPYLEAILKEMGLQQDEVDIMLQDRPSYYMQMEMLAKKLYQSPNFYADLYDKPVNVDRKRVALQAIDLMQKRDMYRSQLRSEAIMSVWLETNLEDLEELYVNEVNPFRPSSNILELPGLP